MNLPNGMVDLGAASGMPACVLDPAALTLHFGPDAAPPAGPPTARTAADLAPVLRDPDAARRDDLLYRVWRGVAPRDAADELARRGLSYAVLLLRAGSIVGSPERCRNRGHVNSAAPGTNLPYPEVHEVWHGSALLYLQSAAGPEPEDVVLLPMEAGDRAVVAPGWASMVVNVGEGPLALGSFRMDDCTTEHEALTSLGGMAHYVVGADFRPWALEANRRYAAAPAPRTIAPRELPDFGLTHQEPLLTTFRRNPDFLRFLLRPQDYASVWASLYADEAAP